ncbi:MAG TPA: hypothetical protein VFV91_00395 [Gaiellaceae bacterium]|nr:hypothetical protein [Gaiellaceae bacterium]
MTTIEGVVIALLALLVGGLLRSYADILHRLHHLDPEGALEAVPEYSVEPGVPLPRAEKTRAYDLVGATPNGDAVKVAMLGTGESTILAFLSSGCLTCAGFWEKFRDATVTSLSTPNDASVVVVTKGPENESVARIIDLAPRNLRVVMSTAAWEDYKVPVAPYFLYVDGVTQTVAGEGAAVSWEQVVSLLRDALEDAGLLRKSSSPSSRRHRQIRARLRAEKEAARERRADAELMAAGIYPGHPSLYENPVRNESEHPEG